MKILILGAAGMVGRKLLEQLKDCGTLQGKEITHAILHDVVMPSDNGLPWETTCVCSDISEPGEVEKLVAGKPDVIFHLAAIVSGEAESDFDKGYRINLDGSRYLFEAVRALNYNPRIIFTSSIAVFGAPFPDAIYDDFLNAPLTSYGVQKACSELMLMDYTRKGFFDGIGIRLPTVVIRPGKPNKAASGFFSNILREPLAGQEAVLPVSRDVRHWMCSPGSAAGFLVHAAKIDGALVGPRRSLTMPGLSITVGEMIDALGRVAGADRVALIKEIPDETIMGIVEGWPRNFDPGRSLELGFKADSSIDAVIRSHIDEELGGKLG